MVFRKGQFQIKGFSDPFRVDRNTLGGGILFYARKDIAVKLLSVENLPTECFFIEINLRKRKWLVCCSYNPHRGNIKDHLNTISANLDLYSSKYEYIIVIKDFNVEVNDKFMSNFCESYNLSILQEYSKFLKELARKLSEKTDNDNGNVNTWLRTRISMEIIRSSLLCLRGSRSPFRCYQVEDICLENACAF